MATPPALADARVCVSASFAFPGTTGSPVQVMQTTLAVAAEVGDVYVLRYLGWRGLRVRRSVWRSIDVIEVPLLRLAPELARLALTRRPHVVHAHGLMGAKLGAVLSWLARCRVVVEFHSFRADLGHSASQPPVRRRAHALADRLLRWRLADVVVYSRAQADEVVADGWAGASDVAVIYPSVDAGFFADGTPPRPLPTSRPVVGYAGNFHAYQGVDLLLEAMDRVWEQHPDVQVELWGGSADDAPLDGRSDDPRVAVKGRVALADMPEVLQQIDVLVIPRPDVSENSTTARKLGEYLASGRPVVVTDVADHRSLVADRAGLVVAPSADGVAGGILDVLADPAAAIERAGHALVLARELFSLEHATHRRLELLSAAVRAAP